MAVGNSRTHTHHTGCRPAPGPQANIRSLAGFDAARRIVKLRSARAETSDAGVLAPVEAPPKQASFPEHDRDRASQRVTSPQARGRRRPCWAWHTGCLPSHFVTIREIKHLRLGLDRICAKGPQTVFFPQPCATRRVWDCAQIGRPYMPSRIYGCTAERTKVGSDQWEDVDSSCA